MSLQNLKMKAEELVNDDPSWYTDNLSEIFPLVEEAYRKILDFLLYRWFYFNPTFFILIMSWFIFYRDIQEFQAELANEETSQDMDFIDSDA